MNNSRYSVQERNALATLSTYSSATLYEALGQIGAIASYIKPISPKMKVCGFAYTVQGKAADNLALHHAIYQAEDCEVIVASVRDYAESGYWGDVMNTAAIARGIRGLVFDGAVRDSEEITSLDFPIFCHGTCIKGTQKSFPGAHRVSIVVGGVLIQPGDFIFGDRDGVVVIPRNRLFEISPLVEARVQKEDEIKLQLQNGQRSIDIYHLMALDS